MRALQTSISILVATAIVMVSVSRVAVLAASIAFFFVGPVPRACAARVHRFASSWEYMGIEGDADELTCDGKTYKGPFEGIGDGAQGVTVKMHAMDGRAVVGKFSKINGKPEKWYSDLFHECDIYKRLVEYNVQRVLACEASCTYGSSGRRMIVISPFVEKSLKIPFILKVEYFLSADALLKAVTNTLHTALDMVYAGVTNYDQASEGNILYDTDGELVFIDMGAATKDDTLKYTCKQHLQLILRLMPRSYWRAEEGSEGRSPMEVIMDNLMDEYRAAEMPRADACGGVAGIHLLQELVEEKTSRRTRRS